MAKSMLGELAKAGQWSEIALRVSSFTGLPVDPQKLQQQCRGRLCWDDDSVCRRRSWSDGTWMVFFKSRVCEMNTFQPCCFTGSSAVVGTFHIGFLYLWETPEMLACLRNERIRAMREASVARSKIGSTLWKCVWPVDRVAGLVCQK